jgi:O-antigen/teichoic acid export membrane protein
MTEPTPEPPPEVPPALQASGQAQSFRRLTRDTAVYLAGNVLSRAVSFIMLPVYTRYLTPGDYGILQMLDLAVDIAAILVSAGATAGAYRFYFKATSEDRRKEILSTAYFVQAIMTGLGAVLLMATAPLIWKHGLGGEGTVTMVRIAAANYCLGTVMNAPLTLMTIRQKSVQFVGVSLVRLVVQLGLNILFVVAFKWGPQGVLLSSFFTYLVLGIGTTIYLFRHTGFRFSLDVWRDFRRFGVPYQFTKAGTFILAFGDRFFLEHYHNLAVVGVYGVAYQFGFLLTGNIAAPFMRAWGPQRHMMVTAPKAERDSRYNRGFRYGSLLLVSSAVAISLLIRPVLHVMVTEEFRAAAPFVPVILAAYLMQAWTDVVDFGISVSEQTRYATYATWASVLVCVLLYWLLIPTLAGMGAAIATLAAMTVRMLLHYRFSQRLWHVGYDWRPHLFLLTWGTAVVLPTFLLPDRFIVQVAAAIVLLPTYLVMVWWTVLTPDDRRIFGSLVRSPRQLLAQIAAG